LEFEKKINNLSKKNMREVGSKWLENMSIIGKTKQSPEFSDSTII